MQQAQATISELGPCIAFGASAVRQGIVLQPRVLWSHSGVACLPQAGVLAGAAR